MPRHKPTPAELESCASSLTELVTGLLVQVRQAQHELVEIGLTVGMTWAQVADLTGKSSGDAARAAHARWKAGRI